MIRDEPVPPASIGLHTLLDIHGAKGLGDPAFIETAIVRAAEAAGAVIIGRNFHHFGLGQGVTGVLLLAESHISIHTWPEHDYAALDLFICGDTALVDVATESLLADFAPEKHEIRKVLRGG